MEPQAADGSNGWLALAGVLLAGLSSLVTAIAIRLIPALNDAAKRRSEIRAAARQEEERIRQEARDHDVKDYRAMIASLEKQKDAMFAEHHELMAHKNRRVDAMQEQVRICQERIESMHHEVMECHKDKAEALVKNQQILGRLMVVEAEVKTIRQAEALANSPTRMEAVVLADERGVIREWSPAATAIFHYQQREAIGKPVTIIVPDNYLAGHTAGFAEVVATGRSVRRGPYRMDARNREGNPVPVEVTLSEWSDGGQRFFNASIRQVVTVEEGPPSSAILAASAEVARGVADQMDAAAKDAADPDAVQL